MSRFDVLSLTPKIMARNLKRLKKIRIHREGTHTLVVSGICFVVLNACLFVCFESKIPFYICLVCSAFLYIILVNFFRCPIRRFVGDTECIVVAPADGKIVVAEQVVEHEYFRQARLMVSIFMSLTNVHANWIPVDGRVKKVEHHSGNYHMAWLPKASLENERSTVVIETPEGIEILVRQVAGAMARRIVTYTKKDEECYIDEHLGFIKFGSRVDLYLPVDSKLHVSLGDKVVGNETVIAGL